MNLALITIKEPNTFYNNDVLTVPDLLPGWEVNIDDLWAVKFDD